MLTLYTGLPAAQPPSGLTGKHYQIPMFTTPDDRESCGWTRSVSDRTHTAPIVGLPGPRPQEVCPAYVIQCLFFVILMNFIQHNEKNEQQQNTLTKDNVKYIAVHQRAD
jgi:hypothetical protein